MMAARKRNFQVLEEKLLRAIYFLKCATGREKEKVMHVRVLGFSYVKFFILLRYVKEKRKKKTTIRFRNRIKNIKKNNKYQYRYKHGDVN